MILIKHKPRLKKRERKWERNAECSRQVAERKQKRVDLKDAHSPTSKKIEQCKEGDEEESDQNESVMFFRADKHTHTQIKKGKRQK